MKKILVLILACVMVFALTASLAACGGKTEPSGGSVATGSSQDKQSSGNKAPVNDLTTVSGYLAAYGLTEDDLKCANFTRIDKTSYNSSTMEIKEVGVYISKKLTDDEVRAWLEQVIGKLRSLSAEGKVANTHADAEGEALTADYIMDKEMRIGGGTYTYNGVTVSIVIAVMPGYLDNDDPDEAMAACTLMLS